MRLQVSNGGGTWLPSIQSLDPAPLFLQIWAGTLTGFFIALCIGAAFIAVVSGRRISPPRTASLTSRPPVEFYTTLNNLWGKTEQIWEGAFSLIAAIIIYLMGIAFLRMDRSRVKWRVKLSAAFDDKINAALVQPGQQAASISASWALAVRWIPARRLEALEAESGRCSCCRSSPSCKGLEAVVFVGGVSGFFPGNIPHPSLCFDGKNRLASAHKKVSLGLPASSIPIAVIVGLIAGSFIGYIIYRTGSSSLSTGSSSSPPASSS